MTIIDKVFVVEDDVNILHSIVLILERAALHVETVTNGAEAIGRIKAFKPDIVLLDVMLPEKSGYEICREIKDDPELKHIPVVMLTAMAQEEEKLKGYAAGASDYITKPFRLAHLQDKVRSILQNRAPSVPDNTISFGEPSPPVPN